MMISRCVGCVAAKLARNNNFPFLCPRFDNTPCRALDSDYVNELLHNAHNCGLSEENAADMFKGIPCEASDKLCSDFIEKMLSEEKKLALQNIVVTYQEGDEK